MIKFTYFAKYGNGLVAQEHYVYLGGCINPPGRIVLQHGTFSTVEQAQIEKNGFIRVYENSCCDYSYLEQWTENTYLRKYREERQLCIGKLMQKTYNLYIGMVRVYSRRYH